MTTPIPNYKISGAGVTVEIDGAYINLATHLEAVTGLPVEMQAGTGAQDANFSINFSRAAWPAGDPMAQETRTRGFMAMLDELTRLGFPREVEGTTRRCVRYQQAQKPADGGGRWLQAERVWLDLGLLQPGRSSHNAAAQVQAIDVNTAFVAVTTEYFGLGGQEVAPAGLPEAAQVGWYRAACAILKAADAAAAAAEDTADEETHQVAAADDDDCPA
jgi:hypothetical protein